MRARLALLLLLPLAGACGPLERLRPAPEPEPEPPASGIMLYLATLQTLAEMPQAGQAELLSDLERSHARAPGTSNTLRLALALASPVHAGADLSRGSDMLDRLLAEDATLLPDERLLANVKLAEARRWAGERQALEAARQAKLAATAQEREEARRQADTLHAELQRLRQALREAEEKLEALMSIERSIRERD